MLTRWAFWLILVAVLIGSVMRTSASILGLGGGLPAVGPTSYGLFQMLLGLVQIAIRILMLTGYRRAGAWARNNSPHAFGTRWNKCEHRERPARLRFLTGIFDACKLGHNV